MDIRINNIFVHVTDEIYEFNNSMYDRIKEQANCIAECKICAFGSCKNKYGDKIAGASCIPVVRMIVGKEESHSIDVKEDFSKAWDIIKAKYEGTRFESIELEV